MSKGYLIVFAAIAGLAFAGTDYLAEQKKQGPGFTPGAYLGKWVDAANLDTGVMAGKVAWFRERLLPGKTARARGNPADHLSAAPEGWDMPDWSEALEARMKPPREMQEFEKEFIESTRIGGVFAGNAEERATEMRESTRIYARGDELIFVTARYARPARQNARSEAAIKFVAMNLGNVFSYSGFDVIGGVPFLRKTAVPVPDGDGFKRSIYEAHMGDSLTLQVVARAAEQSVRDVLAGIDFDGLNAMLETPLVGVGSAAVPMTPAQRQFIAAEHVRALQRAAPGQRRAAKLAMDKAFNVTGAWGGGSSALSLGQAGSAPEADPPTASANRRTLRDRLRQNCGGGTFCKVDP